MLVLNSKSNKTHYRNLHQKVEAEIILIIQR
jgi:hypothetical protein